MLRHGIIARRGYCFFRLIFGSFVILLCPLATTTTTTTTTPLLVQSLSSMSPLFSSKGAGSSIVRIPRTIWRQAALHHQQEVKKLLLPALLSDADYTSFQKQQRRQQSQQEDDNWFRPLDPKNPVCNFLIEYYGLKGHKGTKRLARWSPSPNLLLQSARSYTSLDDFQRASSNSFPHHHQHQQQQQQEDVSSGDAAAVGVFLEDVTEEDFATLLHLRGAMLESDGALYSPSLWFDAKQERSQTSQPEQGAASSSSTTANAKHPASAFLWFRSILQQTLQAEPILHCHGLHEWAMQYHPDGAPPPPSAKYQNHLTLRVGQQVINDAVERKGISCTHVDALRFFAPAAGPLNHHGSSLQRTDQLRLEQPACVHAHMDLLKIGLRLQPFCDTELMRQILDLSMDARRLDVAASPYDATSYGIDVVPIETKAGRAQYRLEQRVLMDRAAPIRRDLLQAYDVLLKLAFDEDPAILESQVEPSAERYATAQAGGKPWRRSLIPSSTAQVGSDYQIEDTNTAVLS